LHGCTNAWEPSTKLDDVVIDDNAGPKMVTTGVVVCTTVTTFVDAAHAPRKLHSSTRNEYVPVLDR
jgi:hypothetical protein